MQHTPGPWTASGPHADGDWLVDAGDTAIADVPTGEANARLIAAAPALLEELTRLVARCDGDEGLQPDGSNMDTQHAHAAIAQATGP